MLCAVWMVLQFVGWGCLCSGGWRSWWGCTHLQHEPRDACQSRKPWYVHQLTAYHNATKVSLSIDFRHKPAKGWKWKRYHLMSVWKKKKRKSIYIAPLYSIQSQGAQTWITQFYLQITPCLPFLHKHSPDGASTECGGEHIIASHYSFIDPDRMKGWVGWFGWPIAEGVPT